MHDSSELKQVAMSQGFEIAGVCSAVSPPHYHEYLKWIQDGKHAGMAYLQRHAKLKESPESLLRGVRSILAVGLNYYQPLPEINEKEAKIARYALGRDYHKVIRKKLKRVSNWAESRYANLRTRVCVDSAPIMERDFAWLAGLGWFGKNTCLINTKRGSWFFIGLLLMNQEFVPDTPARGGCGTCRLCIDACPTGALEYKDGGRVAVMNSEKCISYLTIEHKGNFSDEQTQMLNGWVFGCDVCQEVCPFNHPRENAPLRAMLTNEPEFKRNENSAKLLLTSIVNKSDAELRKEFQGSALMRAVPERLKRNASAILKVIKKKE